jgi:alpha-tubulin suppressor-like RCC1 family protein
VTGGQVATVAAGRSHCLALTKDAKVYTWGARNYLEPHLMKSFIDNKITPVSIAAGDQTSAAIDSSGVLYTWGKNIMSGALGHGTITGQKQPTKVAAFDGIPIAQ